MPLSVFSNKRLNYKDIYNRFVKKFINLGDLVLSNKNFGTKNKIDHFEYILAKRTKNILESFEEPLYLGHSTCQEHSLNVHEKNNAWFDCCNVPDTGICYDGESFRDTTVIEDITREYAEDGWVYTGLENCIMQFEKEIPAIPTFTDIHAYFDTTSMLLSDAQAAKTALTSWFTAFKTANPLYEGNLYIICLVGSEAQGMPNPAIGAAPERWLLNGYFSYTGSPYVVTLTGWTAIQNLPPNYNNPLLYTPPSDLIVLSFVDEAESTISPTVGCNTPGKCGYHGTAFPSFGWPPPPGTAGDPTQPTLAYTSDLSAFDSVYANYNFYKQVLYPIKRIGGVFDANVLQMAAALKARILTATEVSMIPSSVDLSILETENPYTVSLEDNYNFIGVLNKTSPASEVFNSSTFGQELNELLEFNEPTYLYTTQELPVKEMCGCAFEPENIWNLRNVRKGCCDLYITDKDKVLNKLYEFSN